MWRPSAGGPQVLLIHRPTYDDWSFPKGKLDDGEHLVAAAVREVREETGLRVRLGAPLPTARYPLPTGQTKTVHYWHAEPAPESEFHPRETGSGLAPTSNTKFTVGSAAEPTAGNSFAFGSGSTTRSTTGSDADPGAAVRNTSRAGDFSPTAEVDDIAWLPIDAARDRLTHPRDHQILDELVPRPTTPLILLRHGEALPRVQWSGTDADRPLSADGEDQAKRLVPILAAYGISAVISSPAARCLSTVRPYSDAYGLPVRVEPTFAEGVPAAETTRRARELRAEAAPTVWCSHRPTLPALAAGLDIPVFALSPGDLLVLHRFRAPDVATYAAAETHAP